MKVIVTQTAVNAQQPLMGYHPTIYDRPHISSALIVYGKDVEFDINMITYDGFYLPPDCDIDMEIKFTITPKPKETQMKTFK